MSMDEFAEVNRKRAVDWPLQMFRQQMTSGTDPILELVGCLLEDGAGGVISPIELRVTTDNWHTWNQLALSIPKTMSETAEEVLERERLEVPTERESLQAWAATLVLCTLEYMSM